MGKKEWIALVMAGGQGSRLGLLTKKLAKPAVPFGGKYRIIDFTLSNCSNSGIDTVGVLTQYQPLVLNSYVGIGRYWGLNRINGGVTVLPPYVKQVGGKWYQGTANAVYQNIEYIESYHPDYLLVLSGDHIYKMNYSLMLKYHKEKKASATIAVIEVPWEEACRFGIMKCDSTGRIMEFNEKPKVPKSNLASMGVYIFNWFFLKKYLEQDEQNPQSDHDFGKNIIPSMVWGGEAIYAYIFRGYWKDIGTVESYWQANMDLLDLEPGLNLTDPHWRIYSESPTLPPHYLAPAAKVRLSLINEGCVIYGEVDHSVIFSGVSIDRNSVIRNSIVMSSAKIGTGVKLENAIVDENTFIPDNCRVISDEYCSLCCSAPDCSLVSVREKNILIVSNNPDVSRQTKALIS